MQPHWVIKILAELQVRCRRAELGFSRKRNKVGHLASVGAPLAGVVARQILSPHDRAKGGTNATSMVIRRVTATPI
jgi:hypothetical protein